MNKQSFFVANNGNEVPYPECLIKYKYFLLSKRTVPVAQLTSLCSACFLADPSPDSKEEEKKSF